MSVETGNSIQRHMKYMPDGSEKVVFLIKSYPIKHVKSIEGTKITIGPVPLNPRKYKKSLMK